MGEVTKIVRCWECGHLATRQEPDGDAVGCATCFPHWPVLPATCRKHGEPAWGPMNHCDYCRDEGRREAGDD